MNRCFLPVLIALVATGCASQVGDSCSTNADCGSGRICDRSQPGGYCTQSACDRYDCPSEAVCIDFGNQSRYCMQRCGAFAFCREGYVCVLDFPKPDSPDRFYSPFCNQSGVPPAAATDASTPPDNVPQ